MVILCNQMKGLTRSRLKPTSDTVEMEGVLRIESAMKDAFFVDPAYIADSPSDRAA